MMIQKSDAIYWLTDANENEKTQVTGNKQQELRKGKLH